MYTLYELIPAYVFGIILIIISIYLFYIAFFKNPSKGEYIIGKMAFVMIFFSVSVSALFAEFNTVIASNVLLYITIPSIFIFVIIALINKQKGSRL